MIIMVESCPFYPLIVVKTRSGKLNDWANSLARQVFPLQIENSKLLYYIYYIYQQKKGDRYVLVYLQPNLQEKPIIKFLSAYIYPSSDPIFTRTESF